MSKGFTKGEIATYIGRWNNRDTMYIRRVEVVSCGNKQMTLRDAESGELLGRHFDPRDSAKRETFEHMGRGTHNWGGTYKLMSDDEAEALAERIGRECIDADIASAERAIEYWLAKGKTESDPYIVAMRRQIADLQSLQAVVVLDHTGRA